MRLDLLICNNMQEKNKFDTITNKKIIRGALIAGGGAFATILLQSAMQMDFGTYTVFVTAICSILINVIREFIKGNEWE